MSPFRNSTTSPAARRQSPPTGHDVSRLAPATAARGGTGVVGRRDLRTPRGVFRQVVQLGSGSVWWGRYAIELSR